MLCLWCLTLYSENQNIKITLLINGICYKKLQYLNLKILVFILHYSFVNFKRNFELLFVANLFTFWFVFTQQNFITQTKKSVVIFEGHCQDTEDIYISGFKRLMSILSHVCIYLGSQQSSIKSCKWGQIINVCIICSTPFLFDMVL